ncbi:hypothetical protein LBMAG42_30330 [Deltaproteobacteria bacterium]|nr:hypothetical protein LBMAG42_30330 [Deltaproteobacteria bacterium]
MIHRFDRVDSTQRVARELAAAGARHGEAVIAGAQTAGRGRLGRVWASEPGENLLMSVVLRPPGPLAEAPLLTLGAAAGLAVAFGLYVKWPNDLVTREGRKVGGILAELETKGEGIGVVILGLGLNVNQVGFPDGIEGASLRTLGGGAPHDVAAVGDTALRAILAWSSHPQRLDQWRSRSHTLGKRVRIAGREGMATALRDDGALLVDGAPILSGDVEMVGNFEA